MVGMRPMRSVPESGSRDAVVKLTRSSASLTILRARSTASMPTGCEDHASLAAVDQCRLEHAFELLNACAQRRLGHATSLGRAAEMAVIVERHQMPQMA